MRKNYSSILFIFGNRRFWAPLALEFMPTSQEIAQAVRYGETNAPDYFSDFPLSAQVPGSPLEQGTLN